MMFTAKDLRTSLDKDFNLLCFEDIGNLLSTSVGGLYRCLKQNYKQEYLPSDRLVFYSKVPVTHAVLDHISHGLEMFDIEPFFILFCGEVIESKSSFRFQQQNSIVSDGIVWSGDSPKLEFLCPMPWTSIQINNQGKLKPCCVYEGQVGDINDSTINSSFEGPGYQKIRQELLSGQIPTGCRNCFKEETYKQISNRQRSLITFQKEFLLETIETPKIKNLDIRGGITCNMKCRICDEYSSSLWAAEKNKNSIPIIASRDWIDDAECWDQLVELLPQCINIDFFGGEPLLNKKILELFDIAKDTGVAKNIRLNINTNGSIWNSKFIEYFKSFRSVNIGISIDDIQQRFELQRGSSWEIVQENVQKFLSMNDQNSNAYIYATVNIQNVYYLPELLEWADQQGTTVMLSNLNDPYYLDIDYMTPAAKHLVVNKLSQHPDIRLQDIAKRVAKSPGSDGHDFRIFMSDLDKKRQQNFSLAHQEIAIAMGYTV